MAAPKDAQSAYEKAQKAATHDKPAEAEKELNKAVRIYPQFASAWTMLGEIHRQHNQFDLARTEYAQAQAALQWLVEGDGKSLYSLMPDYRSNFIETAENNAESVFEWQNAVNPNDTHDDDTQIGTSDNLNYGTSIPPFFAPSPIGFTDGQARRWPVWEFLQEKTTGGARDPRLAATFLDKRLAGHENTPRSAS